jgi:hypothetical protein
MHEEPRIPERLPLLVVPDGVLLPGASMRFLAASPAALALVRNRLLSRGSLGRYHSSRFEGTSVVDPHHVDADPNSTYHSDSRSGF